MKDKFPNPGEDGYLQFIDGWLSVKLKELKDIENPPVNYKNLLEELDGYVHEIVDFQPAITKCTCGHRNGNHARDCRIHPHKMIILKDTSGGKLGVPSLFLEPVESMAFEIPDKVAQSELVANAIVQEVRPVEIKDLATEENLPAKAATEKSGKKYSFVVLLADGSIVVEDAEKSTNPDFAFDSSTGQWLFTDCAEEAGILRYFKNSTAAAMVIEADSDQLKALLKTFLQILGDAMGEKIYKALK